MTGTGTERQIQRLKTKDMVGIAMFAAILTVCAWISIPAAIPFTLQTFGIFFAVAVLGGKRGSVTVLLYILMGLIGVPVFAGFSGGPGVLFGNTGGYILGFLVSALVMWLMEFLFGKKNLILLISMIAGLAACYLFGTVWFVVVYARTTGPVGMWTALTWCVFPYLIPDAAKIGLAYVLGIRLRKVAR